MTSISPPSIPFSPPPAAWSGPAPSRPPAAATHALSFGDLMRILRQRFFLVTFLTLLGIAATIGVTALVQKYYPLYTTEAIVQVNSLMPSNPNAPLDPQSASLAQDYDRLLLDQSLMALSGEVVSNTLKHPDVRGTTWFKEAEAKYKLDPTIPPEVALRKAVKVVPVRRSSIMNVLASTPDPRDATILVDRLVDEYIRFTDDRSRTTYTQEIKNVKRRRDTNFDVLNDIGRQMEEQISKYPFIRSLLNQRPTTVDQDVASFNDLKNEFSTVSINFKNDWEIIEQGGANELPITDEVLATVENDPLIVDYRRELSQIDRILEGRRARFGPNHREVSSLERSRSDLELKMEATRREARGRLAIQMREDALRRWQTAQRTLTEIEEKLSEAMNKQRDQEDKFKKYRELLARYEIITKELAEQNKNLDMMEAVVAKEQRVNIKFTRAEVPRKRSRPDWPLYVSIGTFASLLFAFGVALLLELSDTSVRTPRDLLRHASLAVLGAIPTADDDELSIEQIETATINAPHSVIAEAFRQLRTNLYFAAPAEQQGALVITSASPNEGKTTVAINLAAAIAMSGRKVLLVDANFRRPMLRTYFPEAKADGLSNVLIGQMQPREVVSSTSVAGLHVMCAGPIPPNPAELLGSGYLRNMLADVRKEYDQIIFDAPPVLLVSDALVLSGACDGVVMVCRFRATSRGTLLRARGFLDGVNARILGAVLNAVEVTRGGYLRKQYRAFYDYQSENQPASQGQLPAAGAGSQSLE